MIKLLPILVLLLLCGCAVYKIEKSEGPKSIRTESEHLVRADVEAGMRIVNGTDDSNGDQCSFVFFFMITVGLFPTHCVTTYDVLMPISGSTDDYAWEAEYRVTGMLGWYLFFMPIIPQWHFGYRRNDESEIRTIVLDDLY